jgi:WD40 repeat protein
MAVSGNGKWIATARDSGIRLWDARKKKPLPGPVRAVSIANSNIFSLALSSDGAFVAAHCMHYGAPGTVYVADVKTGELWRAGEEPGNNARGVAFHPSRPFLAMRGRAGEVAFYDAVARVELQRYSWPFDEVSARVEPQSAWPRNEVSAVCFSPDGLRCAAVGREGVIVWDVDV